MGAQPRSAATMQVIDRLSDFCITIICWIYFTLGFVIFFSPRYLFAYLFSSHRERAFQRLTSLFFRGFFRLVRFLAPRHHWEIDQRISALSSSVVVCNHLSYLDPILLVSLLEQQKTIVKTRFFKIPIFGWLIRNAGYFPAGGGGKFGTMMIDQVEGMGEYLSSGGNLFVFPEGTRSLDGTIGSLNRGSLKIARICKAPVCILHLSGTEKLFTPGKFFFNTRVHNTIRLKIIDRIDPAAFEALSLTELEHRVRQALLLRGKVTS